MSSLNEKMENDLGRADEFDRADKLDRSVELVRAGELDRAGELVGDDTPKVLKRLAGGRAQRKSLFIHSGVNQ